MNSAVLFVSLASLFAASFLLSVSATMAASNRISVKSSLRRLNSYDGVSAIDDELREPFLTRVLLPFFRVFLRIGTRLTPVGFMEGTRQRLVLAGTAREFDADRFLAYKGSCLVIGGGIASTAILFAGRSAGHVLLALIFAVLCFFVPDIWLNQKSAARQKAIRLALPDTLDLLTISVEAGLGFDSAMQKVVRNTTGPLSEEFFRLLQEIQLGTARSDAFRNLGHRTQVNELGSFILAMLQAEVFGISIGKVLRVQATELRIKRRQRAEEMAQKAPVKIIFPLIICIFPAILVVIMGPAMIQIYESIFKSL
ncbi:MAG: type II secretion system F family protein [Candidatus Aquicultor sp.]|nr:type II secretion system F family protein [Candidatus Aquicultor sp.]